tara:strand:+ start:429 stop:551 length:123 start_codon:yes stop_codon:yes gene_type:complete
MFEEHGIPNPTTRPEPMPRMPTTWCIVDWKFRSFGGMKNL